jgi:hypothetical protein
MAEVELGPEAGASEDAVAKAKASEIAKDLRILADALEVAPDLELPQPYFAIHFWNNTDKDAFLALVKLLPRPFSKKYDDTQLTIGHDTTGLDINVYIQRSAVCELIAPAKPAEYRCEPLLSEDEESTLTSGA